MKVEEKKQVKCFYYLKSSFSNNEEHLCFWLFFTGRGRWLGPSPLSFFPFTMINNEDLFNKMCNKTNKLKLYFTYLGDFYIKFM